MRARLFAARGEQAALQEEMKTAERANKILQGQCGRQARSRAELQDKIERRRAELMDVRESFERVALQCESMERQLATGEEEVRRMVEQAGSLSKESECLKTRLATMQHEATALRGELHATQGYRKALTRLVTCTERDRTVPRSNSQRSAPRPGTVGSRKLAGVRPSSRGAFGSQKSFRFE